MLFPIGDDQVKGGYFPLFAYGFIVLNIIAFIFQWSTDPPNPNNPYELTLLTCEYGSIPADIINGKNYFTLLTSMFMHGGWMHLAGNMLFLWVFADNIEATVGSFKFVLFYILGGLAASLGHIYFGMGTEELGCCFPCGNVQGIECLPKEINRCSGSIPTVGASGAISAVLGAYMVMFPKSQVKVLVLIFFRSFKLSAFIFLGMWIAMQLYSGFSELGLSARGGTAWWAHIGGFVFGVVAGFLFKEKGNLFLRNDTNSTSPPPKTFDKDDLV